MNTVGNVLLADDEDLFRLSTAALLRVEHSEVHRIMSEIHQRLNSAAAGFAAGRDQLSPHADPSRLVPLSLVRDVSTALAKILRLRASLGCQDGHQTLCRLLDCNMHPNCEQAIAEMIEVLQRTKSSFKSKELGALRLRLESMLDKPHFLPPPHIPFSCGWGSLALEVALVEVSSASEELQEAAAVQSA